MERKTLVAITGASGAMGSEAVKLLARNKNLQLRLLLFKKEGKPARWLRAFLKQNRDNVSYFYGDIADKSDCEKLTDGADYLLHMAAYIPPKSDHDAEQTRLSDYVGTKNLVDAVIEQGNRTKFIHICTVAIYGNRAYPHNYGRVGDPVISSDYDNYSLWKLKGERYVLDAGLKHFVSLRQTGVLHKWMFKNNLKDGLVFHTSWNCCLEWVTDRDSAILCQNLIERDQKNLLAGFWNRCYNIGGGKEQRKTGYEVVDRGFSLMGSTAKKFFKPNWNIPRNFHGTWYTDSDELEDFLGFRHETFEDYWRRMGKKYWFYRLGKLAPPALVSRLAIQRLFKNTNAPMYWVNHNKTGRLQAFYGGKAEFDRIGTDWSKFPLLNEGFAPDGSKVDIDAMRDPAYAEKNGLLLSHGYDDKKKIEDWTEADFSSAAAFRGGEYLGGAAGAENAYRKTEWKCHEGHVFSSAPYTVLKGGYWCPVCAEPKPWRYGALAKVAPFYAQVYFDTHTKEEADDVYPLTENEDLFMEKEKI